MVMVNFDPQNLGSHFRNFPEWVSLKRECVCRKTSYLDGCSPWFPVDLPFSM